MDIQASAVGRSAGAAPASDRISAYDVVMPNGIPLNSLATYVIDEWEVVPVTTWQSDKLGPNSGWAPELGQPPSLSNDMGSGAHIAWSDTNKCNDQSNNNMYTICYTHVLTGQVDVFLEDGDADWLHVIEPGEETMFNMTINNTTPGPIDLVADIFSLNLTVMCVVPKVIADAHGISQECNGANWTATMFFSSNHTAIFPETSIYLKGGEAVRSITTETVKQPVDKASAPSSPGAGVHFVLVSPGDSPAALVERARGLCLGEGYCRVQGWSDAAKIPAELPLTDEARHTLRFSFVAASAGSEEAVFFDCRTFPAPAVGTCLPARP